MGIDTIFVTVLCILSTILNKLEFLIMPTLICIYRFDGMTTQLYSTIKPYTIQIHSFTSITIGAAKHSYGIILFTDFYDFEETIFFEISMKYFKMILDCHEGTR